MTRNHLECVIENKARRNSVFLDHTGDWLNVVPSNALELPKLCPQKLMASVLSRLGVPVAVQLTMRGFVTTCWDAPPVASDMPGTISCS